MNVRKICNIIVTVLFLAMIFTIGIGTVWKSHDSLIRSVTNHSTYVQYYPEDATIEDKLKARITSFQTSLNDGLFLRQTGLTINLAAEGFIGKSIMQFSSNRMVFLKNGWLYDLQDKADLTEQLDEVVSVKESLDVPFIFVYEHSTLYDETQLPDGMELLDHNMETADNIIDTLSANGVECIDSRAVLADCGYSYEELTYRTDQHWNTRAGLIMAQSVAKAISEKGISIETSNIDTDKFETEVKTGNFLGRYGQRIGVDNVKPDDVTVFWPKYETSMRRYTMRKSQNTADVTGTFSEAVIRWGSFDLNRGTYSTNSYKAYGLTESEDHYYNYMIEDGARILVLKDSFGCPVSAFLSLTAEEVLAVDMRSAEKTLQEYIDEFKPDVVIMAYSQQMLRDQQYDYE